MTKATDDKKIDDLLKQAARTKAQAERATSAAQQGMSKGDIVTDAKLVREGFRTVGRAVAVAKEVWRTVYGLGKPVFDAVGSLGSLYKKHIWNNFAYKHEKTEVAGKTLGVFKKKKRTGEKSFSKKRAAGVLMASFAIVAAFTPSPMPVVGQAGDVVRTAVNETVVLPTLMVATGKHETIYASRDSQTSIDRVADTFQVRGAREETFTNENSIYYEIRPALVHSLTQGPLYNPRVAASAIPSGDVAKCEIFSYGLRDRFSLAMGFNPILVKATCTTTSLSGVTNTVIAPVTVTPNGGPG